MTIKWFGDTTITEKSEIISLQISGVHVDRKYNLDNVRTTSTLDLPAQSLNTSILGKYYDKLNNVPLNYPPDKPRILIGLDNSSLCYPENSFEVGRFMEKQIQTSL